MEDIRDLLINQFSLVLFFVLWRVFSLIRSKLKEERREANKKTLETLSKILLINNKLTELKEDIGARTVILAAIHNSGKVLSPASPWFKRVLYVQPFNRKYVENSVTQILDTSYYEKLYRLQERGFTTSKLSDVPPDSFSAQNFELNESKSSYLYLLQDAKDGTFFMSAIFYFEEEAIPEITEEFKNKLQELKWLYTAQDFKPFIPAKKK